MTPTIKPSRVRNPQQLQRKRLLDRLSQQTRRQRHASYVEALHEDNQNLRLEIARLRSISAPEETTRQNITIPSASVLKLLQCCCEAGEHSTQLVYFEMIVFDILMQCHLNAPPPLPRTPSLEDLLFLRQPENPASMILNIVLRRPSLQDLVLRTACYLICWRIFRYRLSPSRETYNDVPSWLRTSDAEDNTPHPVYADFILFPRLREAFVLGYFDLGRDMEQFELDFTKHVSLRWPPSESLIVLNHAHDTVLNPEFEPHVFTLENWSLDERFAQKYPHVAPFVRLRD